MKTKTKLIIGCVAVFLVASVVYGLVTGQFGDEPTAPVNQTTQTPPSSQAPTLTPAPTTEPPTPTVDPEIVKANALQANEALWAITSDIDATMQELYDTMATGDALATYQKAEAIKDPLIQLQGKSTEVSCDGVEGYRTAVKDYAMYSSDAVSRVIKWLDKQEVKYEAEAQDALKALQDRAITLALERTKFLSAAGLTTEEIAAITK